MQTLAALLAEYDETPSPALLDRIARHVPASPADMADSLALLLDHMLDGKLSRDLAETWSMALALGASSIASSADRLSMIEAELAELQAVAGVRRSLN
jgi:hypothetical protein